LSSSKEGGEQQKLANTHEVHSSRSHQQPSDDQPTNDHSQKNQKTDKLKKTPESLQLSGSSQPVE